MSPSRKVRVGSNWASHLSKEEREDFLDYVESQHRLLARLKDMLEAKYASQGSVEFSYDTYDAGYPFRQAFINGKKAAITEVLDLLNFIG